MNLGTVLKYTLLGIVALVVVSAAVSLVLTIVSVVWAIVTTVVSLLVLGGLVYLGIKAALWLRGDDESTAESDSFDVDFGSLGSDSGSSIEKSAGSASRSGSGSADPVERLKRRYADGEISEAEFERRLELALDDGGIDSVDRGIDRELERERR